MSQTGNETRSLAWIGDAVWGDMDFEVQARKTGGAEGFLLPFHVCGADDLVWLNLGGWGNTEHALQKTQSARQNGLGSRVAGRIETGRWYRIKIELRGTAIRCFLDDQLILEARDAAPAEETIYAAASREDKSGDLLLKVFNMSAQTQPVQLDFAGLSQIGALATGEILVGSPTDLNTLENPVKVVPRALVVRGAPTRFEHRFPAHSLSAVALQSEVNSERSHNSPDVFGWLPIGFESLVVRDASGT